MVCEETSGGLLEASHPAGSGSKDGHPIPASAPKDVETLSCFQHLVLRDIIPAFPDSPPSSPLLNGEEEVDVVGAQSCSHSSPVPGRRDIGVAKSEPRSFP